MKGTYEYTTKDYAKGYVYAKSKDDASNKSGYGVKDISFYSTKKLKRLL